MNTQAQTGRAPNSAVMMLVVGLIGGLAGGLLFSGYLPVGASRDPVPDANLSTETPGNTSLQDRRTSGSGTDRPETGQSVEVPAEPTPQGEEPAPDPFAAEALRALIERQAAEEKRLNERERLAYESALTPSVTPVAERIRARREAEAAAAAQPGTAGTAPDAQLLQQPPAASPPSPRPGHVLARGSVIPAVLETPLDSDLPGLVRARVSRDVYDSRTGLHILIPRGAQLVGTYGTNLRSGQKRLFVTWTDLRMPDGTRLDLADFSTLGQDGAAGVKGRRSTGLLAAFGAAVLFDLAGNATQILTGDAPEQESDLQALLAGATGTATSRVAERYLGDLLDHGPRFRVKAGAVMNVLVEEDLTLPARTGRDR